MQLGAGSVSGGSRGAPAVQELPAGFAWRGKHSPPCGARAAAALTAPSVLGMGVDVDYLEQFGTSQVSTAPAFPEGEARRGFPGAAITPRRLDGAIWASSCSAFLSPARGPR